MRNLIVYILLVSSLSFSQTNKFLISPNQEVIPVSKDAVKRIMEQFKESQRRESFSACDQPPLYGFTPAQWPLDQNFGFYHKDACGQWYVIPADGSIDTVYFATVGNVGPSPVTWPGTMDSTVILRIFQSNITPGQGPGVRPGPYHPPCTSWGYYLNTNDDESGIAPYVEEATPPDQSSWFPTNIPPYGSDSVASFPPFGTTIWGIGGYPVKHIRPYSIIKVAMNDLTPLTVHKGDVIFISFKIPSTISLDDATQDTRFEIWGSDQNAPYPSRDWKFYEHDSGPTNCAGTDRNTIKRGWVARGSLTSNDTLDASLFNIWFSMTPTSNTPPQFASVEPVRTTLSTAPQTISCTVFDCDPANTALGGVENVWIRYSLDWGQTWTTIPMTYLGADEYSGTLPGVNPMHTMEYKIVAEDSTGLTDSSAIYSYKVVSLDDARWYRVDTSTSCTAAKLPPGGTIIDTSEWFIASRSFRDFTKPGRGDNGTAGPFPINGGFVYYGDTMHFAWVGVNGATALSKTATDTIDLNAGGFFTNSWDLPYPQHHSRADTLNDKYMPKAFIAPYWADWINKQDSPLVTSGHVRYLDDVNKFVVEWDSLADPDSYFGGVYNDINVFRVVLYKTDYSIEFQYDEIGIGGLDTINLVGIQSDSNYHPQSAGQDPPFSFFNKDGYPIETRLHNGMCVKYLPVIFSLATYDGWNLLSLPGVVQNNSVRFLFPGAIGPAFIFQCDGGYIPSWTVDTGQGFWLKFIGANSIPMIGRVLNHLNIYIGKCWGMIGSIGVPIPVANITADPSTGIGPSSMFFGYSGGFFPAAILEPGHGYFVRSRGPGQIHLDAGTVSKVGEPYAELNALDKITISQNKTPGYQTLYIGSGPIDANKYEMPPHPPEGALDVRFASNRMVEIYPDILEKGKKYEYPILLNASQYPLTIRWEQAQNNNQTVTLTLKTEDGKVLAIMTGSGKITLSDANIKKLIVSVSPGIVIPTVFALGKNYPNPFNPATQFTVEVPRNSQIDISVYDLLGRNITTLWNGEQQAGYHTMEWDGRDGQGLMAPTGIYFIRMNAPEEKFSGVQKIMLMK